MGRMKGRKAGKNEREEGWEELKEMNIGKVTVRCPHRSYSKTENKRSLPFTSESSK